MSAKTSFQGKDAEAARKLAVRHLETGVADSFEAEETREGIVRLVFTDPQGRRFRLVQYDGGEFGFTPEP